VPLAVFRQRLIGVFQRWGQCGAMRVDNGDPLGSPQPNTTSVLALWLIGQDVDMIFNKPRCPTANAKVERMQEVSSRWAEIHKASHLLDLQTRLDHAACFQREQFGVSRLGFKTRLAVFPQLETTRRVYRAEGFDPQRVYTFLATKVYVRSVSEQGQIDHFGERTSLGRVHRGQSVSLRLGVDGLSWQVYLGDSLIKTYPALSLSQARLEGLSV
jgi:hypothetical protein